MMGLQKFFKTKTLLWEVILLGICKNAWYVYLHHY